VTPKQARKAALLIARHVESIDNLCDSLHHTSRDRHEDSEPCPVTVRLLDAAYRLCEFFDDRFTETP
jgi:hypothetical protein